MLYRISDPNLHLGDLHTVYSHCVTSLSLFLWNHCFSRSLKDSCMNSSFSGSDLPCTSELCTLPHFCFRREI